MKFPIYLIIPLILAGCTHSSPNAPASESGNDEHSTDPGATTHVDSSLTKVALHREITGVQPGTGIVFWPDQAKANHAQYGDGISLEFSYCLPSEIVLGKQGNQIPYNWTPFDSLLDDIASRNHQAVIRFRYEYPSGREVDGNPGTTAVPAYIKSMNDYHETYSENPGGDGPTWYADWSHPELQWFTMQFYDDFAQRYQNDPRIAFLEIGFGHWSEYHIYGTDLDLGRNFPSKSYQETFLRHIEETMQIPWLISIDAADDEYSPITASNELMQLHFGLFDDSFMHEEHEITSGDGYNERCWHALGDQRWQTSPNGGEISYYDDSDQKNFLNPEGMYGTTWEQASAKYHLSFMIANDALNGKYATPERVRTASMKTGYAFHVTECATGNSHTELQVCNQGIAPLYRDAWFAIGSTRSTDSLKGLLPKQCSPVSIAAELILDTDLHIISDEILPAQTIEFSADTTP